MNFFEKLRADTARYWDSPFLEASMAVCALASLADGEVSLTERYRVDAILDAMERLQVHDPDKAIEILNAFIADLRAGREESEALLEEKVSRFADDYKSARTLLRIAYLVITADERVSMLERETFDRICATLDVDPKEIWEKMAETKA